LSSFLGKFPLRGAPILFLFFGTRILLASGQGVCVGVPGPFCGGGSVPPVALRCRPPRENVSSDRPSCMGRSGGFRIPRCRERDVVKWQNAAGHIQPGPGSGWAGWAAALGPP